jgi:hypothetical protein
MDKLDYRGGNMESRISSVCDAVGFRSTGGNVFVPCANISCCFKMIQKYALSYHTLSLYIF